MPSRAEFARLLSTAPAPVGPRDVVVCERRPVDFMRVFAEAVVAGGRVFVADPDWDAARRELFDGLVETPMEPAPAGASPDCGWLCLPTGGSGGGVKLARHDEATLSAAVEGFARHFEVDRVHALGLLPLNHVSGFMAWMRTVFTGGDYLPGDWSEIAAGRRPVLPRGRGGWFVSLVPTQLNRLLDDPGAIDWLRGFRAVLLGGGPAWPELLERAAAARLPLAFSYGSTETGAMAAALCPEAFLAGRRDSGTALPHVRLGVSPEDERLSVDSPSLFRGYWPGWRPPGAWRTDDRAALDAEGRLVVLGRADALIITGGKKVDPLAVEAVLRSIGRWADVAVLGVPDPDWGQRVVACHSTEPGARPNADPEGELRTILTPSERPKAFVPVNPWPRDAKGKVDRSVLAAAVRRTTC